MNTHSCTSIYIPAQIISRSFQQADEQTHTHKHTSVGQDRHTVKYTSCIWSRQWCITCSGLAQSPPCLCIRCHSGSNVMSLASCGPCRRLTLLHTDRTKLDRTIDRLPIYGRCWEAHMQTHPCVKELDHSHTPQVTALLTGDSVCRSPHRESRRSGKRSQPSLVPGGQPDNTHQHQSIFHSRGTARPWLICLGPLKSRLNLSRDIL